MVPLKVSIALGTVLLSVLFPQLVLFVFNDRLEDDAIVMVAFDLPSLFDTEPDFVHVATYFCSDGYGYYTK